MSIKKGPIVNLLNMAKENNLYRKVRYTSEHMQIVTMSLPPLDFIKKEVHCEHDQFFYIVEGKGCLEFDNEIYTFGTGDTFVIPAKKIHYLKNTSSSNNLKLYTIYTPPEHKYDREDISNPDLNKTRSEKTI